MEDIFIKKKLKKTPGEIRYTVWKPCLWTNKRTRGGRVNLETLKHRGQKSFADIEKKKKIGGKRDRTERGGPFGKKGLQRPPPVLLRKVTMLKGKAGEKREKTHYTEKEGRSNEGDHGEKSRFSRLSQGRKAESKEVNGTKKYARTRTGKKKKEKKRSLQWGGKTRMNPSHDTRNKDRAKREKGGTASAKKKKVLCGPEGDTKG